MAKYWIKLYIEILNDSKMAVLPDRLWRRITEIFLAAGHFDSNGHLPNTSQLAWLLRMDTDELELDLQQLASTGMIQRTEYGWFVTQFSKRQARIPDSERQRQHRKGEKEKEYYESATEVSQNVTQNQNKNQIQSQNTESEEINNIISSDEKISILELSSLFADKPSAYMTKKLLQTEKDMPNEWIKEAFRIAEENNVHKWSYVSKILNNWQEAGKMYDLAPSGKYRSTPYPEGM